MRCYGDNSLPPCSALHSFRACSHALSRKSSDAKESPAGIRTRIATGFLIGQLFQLRQNYRVLARWFSSIHREFDRNRVVVKNCLSSPSCWKQYTGIYPPLEVKVWSICFVSKSIWLIWSNCNGPGPPGCHPAKVANDLAYMPCMPVQSGYKTTACSVGW